MLSPRVVVVGGSAGALDALQALARHLPGDFPAAVLVVVHVSPDYPSRLPAILNAAGPLEARHAQNGEALRAGVIYVAPPDHHLLVGPDRVRLTHGPKENRARPAIDVLFRSAAYTRGPGALGVLLSGMLDDGASGLWTIKRRGGRAIVQHPEEALYPAMPLAALQQADVDDIVRTRDLPGRVLDWARSADAPTEASRMNDEEDRRLRLELSVADEDGAFDLGILKLGPLSTMTCPECHGVMVQRREGRAVRFRCHTGHAFSLATLLSSVRESVEDALWNSVRALDEQVMLLEHLAKHFDEAGDSERSGALRAEAERARARNRMLREAALHTQDTNRAPALDDAFDREDRAP